MDQIITFENIVETVQNFINSLGEAEVKTINKDGVKVGDIFVASWGYDQTNVNAYQVIKVTKASAVIKEIHTKTVQNEKGNDRLEPVKDDFVDDAEEMTRRTNNRGSITTDRSYKAYKHETGKTYYFSTWY